MVSPPPTTAETDPPLEDMSMERWLEEWNKLAPIMSKHLDAVGGVEAWMHYLRHGDEDEEES